MRVMRFRLLKTPYASYTALYVGRIVAPSRKAVTAGQLRAHLEEHRQLEHAANELFLYGLLIVSRIALVENKRVWRQLVTTLRTGEWDTMVGFTAAGTAQQDKYRHRVPVPDVICTS